MLAIRRLATLIRIGKIGTGKSIRARMRATRNEARNAARFATGFSTRLATSVATYFASFPQFSTMFVRASFARGKAFKDKGIRRRRRVRSSGETARLWKNVE